MSALAARVVVRRAHFDVDVQLSAATGESVAVMGPSGAGKSTLLAAIAGLVPLHAGEIRIGDRVVDRAGPGTRMLRLAPMRRGAVLLGQDPRLFPHLSASENVAFGPRASGVGRAEARRDADEWLARVGLPGAGHRRPGELSGGEQQRVAVARALAARPRVVLLDEPLVALDPVTAGEIRAMLRTQLADTTVIAVTHDAVDAAALAERLVVVDAGRVVQRGPVRDVLAAPATGFVAALAGRNRLIGRAVSGAFEAGDVRLTSTDGPSIRLAAREGAPLAAVFRPADVRRGDGEGAWTARVESVEPTPTGIRIRAGECAVDLAVEDGLDVRPGMALRLRVAPEHVRFIAAEAAE
ncbi:ABC transporter ATP-binding protein [Microbacterium sp. NPDC091313]